LNVSVYRDAQLLWPVLKNLPAFAPDRFEKFNRGMFAFNQGFDKMLLKPAATVYQKALPWPVRTGVTNFFSNLSELPTFASDVLQWRLKPAGQTAGRFLLNSTVGILGVVDVATKAGIPQDRQDFGTAFAKWGDRDSPYLVLPFFGPSTVRDTFAMPFNWSVGIYPHLYPRRLRNELVVLDAVRFRANLLDADSTVNEASMDRYIFERDAYLQLRRERIKT
jgi:phospholipid-binding lipoprotein MlaA